MHCNARLSYFSRELLIKRYLDGEKVATIARQLGVSRKCCYKWIGRYKEKGREGLVEKKSGPKASPRKISSKKEKKILRARRNYREGPDRLAIRLNMSSSTIYQVLKRNKENHLFAKKRREPVKRYERKYPGDLLHIDIKHIPALGGRRYRYHVSILDDCTRYTEAQIFEKKTTKNITSFMSDFLERFPFEVKEVMTDNGMEFTMRYACFKDRKTLFEKELAKRGIKHFLIKPRHPETNGKVERFHKTVDDELYQIKHFISEEHRKRELQRYIRRYNLKRIHLGIKGMSRAKIEYIFIKKVLPSCVRNTLTA